MCQKIPVLRNQLRLIGLCGNMESRRFLIVELMQIRWRNTKKHPIYGSPGWIKFTARYPFIVLIPTGFMFYLAWFLWQQLQRMEAGQLDSVYVGELKLLYKVFGKWGVSGFFVFIGLSCLYLFYYYALSD